MTRSRSASVLDGAMASRGTSSPVAGRRYWTRLWCDSSVSSSTRMPVWRRTSMTAQAQNAWSSSRVRSRRLPVTGSSAQVRGDGWARRARRSCWPPAVNVSPGAVARAAASRAAASLRLRSAAAARAGRAGSLSRVRASEPAAQFPCPGAVVAGGLKAGQHLVAPVRGLVGLGAAGVPSLLPRRSGVQFEPVEDLQHGQLPPVPDAGPFGDERRGEHPPHHGEPVRGGRRPGRRDRAGREPVHHRQGLGAEPPRRGLRRGGACVAAVTSGPSRTARPGFPAGSPAPAREGRAWAPPAAGGEPAWPR